MSSTNHGPRCKAFGALFDDVLMHSSSRALPAAERGMALAPDVCQLSYYVHRSHSAMSHASFEAPSCADFDALAQGLRQIWQHPSKRELVAAIPAFVAAARQARELYAGKNAPADVSPYLYVMF